MNLNKIGFFIKKLREERNLTQEKLADLIPISRQAVSKWERGLAVPDSSVLLRLSEIFNISINEILIGEKINQNNVKEVNTVFVKLYDDNKRKDKFIKMLVFIIFIFIFLLLLIYFVNSYKSIKVYTISAFGNKISITDGIFVKTNEKLFFRIGDFQVLNDSNIEQLNLYYLNDKKERENIVTTYDDYIVIVDYCGYNEYFDIDNIDTIMNNLYVEIQYKNDSEILKLNFEEDYINDSFWTFKDKPINDNDRFSKMEKFDLQNNNLIQNIKDNYEKTSDGYLFISNDDKILLYNDESKNIRLSIGNSSQISERWIYQINLDMLEYQNYDMGIAFIYTNEEIDCIKGNCNMAEDLIIKFYQELSNSLK